jgi:hypothetical protein
MKLASVYVRRIMPMKNRLNLGRIAFCFLFSVCINTHAGDSTVYVDKNKFFQFTPPGGWVKKEFADPRTKVSFDAPSPIPGQNKAGLFFLSHPLSGDVNVRAQAEDRVARLKRMGSPDAKVTTVAFAGENVEQIDGQMARQNARIRVLMFTKYQRSYVISFSATSQDFNQYWPIAERALETFKCLPPEEVDITTSADKERIQTEKIRVWIAALKEADLGIDAFDSLLVIGQPAIPQLEEAQRTGTELQREKASQLLEKIREKDKDEKPSDTESAATALAADTRVIGRMLDQHHKPVLNLHFQLAQCVVENGNMDLVWSAKTNELKAQTDTEGRFEFQHVPIGSWAITIPGVSCVGGIVNPDGSHAVITVETGASQTIDLGDLNFKK